MTNLEKEELKSRFEALDEEELDFIMNFIPTEKMIKKIGERYKIQAEMISSIRGIVKA